jgi:CO/xanthine dehydrogenase Mo-binding subunit
LVPPPPIADLVFHQRTQVPLARGKVRHAGEPLAVVVAESWQVVRPVRASGCDRLAVL